MDSTKLPDPNIYKERFITVNGVTYKKKSWTKPGTNGGTQNSMWVWQVFKDVRNKMKEWEDFTPQEKSSFMESNCIDTEQEAMIFYYSVTLKRVR